MGKVFKGLMKFTVAAATLGGVCYVFRDKIRESKVYQDYDMDTKIKKVANTIKDKMPKVFDNEEDYVDEDEIFFDDLDLAAEDVERDYVSLEPEENTVSESDDVPAGDTDEAESDDAEVPTIEM